MIPRKKALFDVAGRTALKNLEEIFARYEEEERGAYWKSLGVGTRHAIKGDFLSRMKTDVDAVDLFEEFRRPGPQTSGDRQ